MARIACGDGGGVRDVSCDREGTAPDDPQVECGDGPAPPTELGGCRRADAAGRAGHHRDPVLRPLTHGFATDTSRSSSASSARSMVAALTIRGRTARYVTAPRIPSTPIMIHSDQSR